MADEQPALNRQMHALEIKLNGALIAVTGSVNALMFSAQITASIEERTAKIDVRGMNDLGNERQSHTVWLEQMPLTNGDRVELRFVAVDACSPHLEEVATDSPEYLADQAAYEAQLDSEPLTPRSLSHTSPNVAFELSFTDGEPIISALESGREFISCNIVWDKWQPERCRVRLSSFSQEEALARNGGREWYSGSLRLGASCSVEIRI